MLEECGPNKVVWLQNYFLCKWNISVIGIRYLDGIADCLTLTEILVD